MQSCPGTLFQSVSVTTRILTRHLSVFPSKMTAFGYKEHGDAMHKSQPMGTPLPPYFCSISRSRRPHGHAPRHGRRRYVPLPLPYPHAADPRPPALFLASPASAHVTGAHIPLDGGALVSRMRASL